MCQELITSDVMDPVQYVPSTAEMLVPPIRQPTLYNPDGLAGTIQKHQGVGCIIYPDHPSHGDCVKINVIIIPAEHVTQTYSQDMRHTADMHQAPFVLHQLYFTVRTCSSSGSTRKSRHASATWCVSETCKGSGLIQGYHIPLANKSPVLHTYQAEITSSNMSRSAILTSITTSHPFPTLFIWRAPA
jgi:hypothetical protein